MEKEKSPRGKQRDIKRESPKFWETLEFEGAEISRDRQAPPGLNRTVEAANIALSEKEKRKQEPGKRKEQKDRELKPGEARLRK